MNGQEFRLGRHGTPEALEAYHRITGEWQANRRRVIGNEADRLAAERAKVEHQTAAAKIGQTTGYSVAELIVAFRKFAHVYYVDPEGKATPEVDHLDKRVLKDLGEMYGLLAVADFGPLKLKALRAKWIDTKLSRTTINQHVRRVVRMIAWGVENELVSGATLHALKAVKGLRAGRSDAKEPERIRPVSDDDFEATLP